jgi:hypothetical protein
MPGLKSGPISEAKAITEKVYSAGVVVRPGSWSVARDGADMEMDIDPPVRDETVTNGKPAPEFSLLVNILTYRRHVLLHLADGKCDIE